MLKVSEHVQREVTPALRGRGTHWGALALRKTPNVLSSLHRGKAAPAPSCLASPILPCI